MVTVTFSSGTATMYFDTAGSSVATDTGNNATIADVGTGYAFTIGNENTFGTPWGGNIY